MYLQRRSTWPFLTPILINNPTNNDQGFLSLWIYFGYQLHTPHSLHVMYTNLIYAITLVFIFTIEYTKYGIMDHSVNLPQ